MPEAPKQWNRGLVRHLLSWTAGRRKLFRVRGHSMFPTLGDGDLVLVKSASGALPIVGSIVVAHHPHQPRVLVKRIVSCGTDTVSLGSDNPNDGSDSRQFGSVSAASVIGIVVYRFPRGWQF